MSDTVHVAMLGLAALVALVNVLLLALSATVHAEILVGCTVASAIGVGLNLVLIAQKRAKPQHALFRDVFDESGASAQLWTYMTSMAFQAVVYPPCIVWAWLQWRGVQAAALARGESELLWAYRPGGLFAKDGEEDPLAFRLFLYAFCGYLIRDTMMQLLEPVYRPMMLLHHSTCIMGVLIGLNVPVFGAAVALGIFCFEIGSFFYNGWVIDSAMREMPSLPCWPRGDARLVPVLYVAVFSLSNLVGGWMLYLAVWENWSAGHLVFAGAFTISGVPLLYLRQEQCNRYWLWGKMSKPGAGKPASHAA